MRDIVMTLSLNKVWWSGMRPMLLIFTSLTCCLAVEAQSHPLPSPEPIPIIINFPSELPSGRIQGLSFKYEDRCGSPLVESMSWGVFEGKAVSVSDGNTMTIVLKDKRRKRVKLVGIAAPKSGQSFGA